MRLLLIALVMLMNANAHAESADANAMRKEIARHAQARWVALDTARWQQARDAFAALIARRGEPTPEDRAAWTALGYRLQPLDGKTRFALLPDRASVAAEGIFLFDTANARRDAVQAPHTRDDVGTADLAVRMFLAGNLFAAMTGTTRRGTVDLARAPRTLFTAFAAALAAHPDAVLLQLHGFERGKRTSTAGREADSVTSSGRRAATARALALRDCLAQQLGGQHRVYGVDIDELGGTRNASLAQFPEAHGGFLHLELSRTLRDRLLASPEDQGRFFGCLLP